MCIYIYIYICICRERDVCVSLYAYAPDLRQDAACGGQPLLEAARLQPAQRLGDGQRLIHVYMYICI